jgi:hypothetical protein
VHSICRAPASTAASAVRRRHAEVVVAMGRDRHLVHPRHALEQHPDQGRALPGRRVAHRVGDVDRGRTRPDRDLADPREVVVLGPRRVHRRPLHVLAEVAGMGDGGVDALGHRLLVEAHLVFPVQRRGADEGVDARAPGVAHRLPGPVDVGEVGPGEAADDASFVACAIFETASKSPSEAIGKPASMMSTPISSRIWAICSFSSSVIVAPGDCSPSRSVVSKIRTRGCGCRDGGGCGDGHVVGLALKLCVGPARGRSLPLNGRAGTRAAQRPLSRRRPPGSPAAERRAGGDVASDHGRGV